MIFVPNKDDCIVWNETENGIYISYCYNKQDFLIRFHWGLTPHLQKDQSIKYIMDYDPFYLTVEQCMHEMVLDCPLSSCSGKPQLRYNKIIDKWYCNCPSSAICTKNNDEDELNEMLAIYQKQYDYKHGFCNNPIEAILKWNISCAESYKENAKHAIKEYKQLNKVN